VTNLLLLLHICSFFLSVVCPSYGLHELTTFVVKEINKLLLSDLEVNFQSAAQIQIIKLKVF